MRGRLIETGVDHEDSESVAGKPHEVVHPLAGFVRIASDEVLGLPARDRGISNHAGPRKLRWNRQITRLERQSNRNHQASRDREDQGDASLMPSPRPAAS